VSYRFLDHITWADTAFEVRASSLEALFSEAAQATLSVMISDPEALKPIERRQVEISVTQAPEKEEDGVAELLHEFLERLLFFKDADQLLLKVQDLTVIATPASAGATLWRFQARLAGEPIDPERQELLTDVKAVTHHQFEVRREGQDWVATVVLDV
jgi:SHS2 domain-containing protein